MNLTVQQSHELLAKHACYVTEACDKCGQLLGAVRYTRRGEPGVWCSRECRGDGERPAIRKGGRPRKYQTDSQRELAERQQGKARQRVFRAGLCNGKPPRILLETKDLQAQKTPLSHYPLTGAFQRANP